MRVLICSVLPFCMALGLWSCTWTEGLYVTSEIVRLYPADNFIEDDYIEPFLEEKLHLEPGSLDLTPRSPEKKPPFKGAT